MSIKFEYATSMHPYEKVVKKEVAEQLLEALQRCESVLSNIPLEVCDVEDLLYARAAIAEALGETK